jgi:hypothetical protein
MPYNDFASKGTAPQVLAHPGARPTETKGRTVDTKDSSALAHPSSESEAKLTKLEERLSHELMNDEER